VIFINEVPAEFGDKIKSMGYIVTPSFSRLAWRQIMNKRPIWLLAAGACLIASALPARFAFAQSAAQLPTVIDARPIGKILSVTGVVRVDHTTAVILQARLSPSGDDHANVGDRVYRGDTVQTGPDGALGVVFDDGTSFNVSSNAKMELNEFVYDPRGHSNSTLLTLTKGTFTFIAGNIAHTGGMKVDTPVGTMGIRGTAPRVEILDDGTVKFSTLVEHK
jgi:hypothetical protein